MLCYEGLYIGAAAVAKFYGLLVKDLVKTVVLGEVLADQRLLYKAKWGKNS